MDGDFGNNTLNAVLSFQNSKGLISDGIVGVNTYNAIVAAYKRTNDNTNDSMIGDLPDWIEYYPLNDGQYIKGNFKKIGVCLHNTVSDGNPYSVVDGWNRDSRLASTEFIIGNKMLSGDNKHNGRILQCMPINSHGYHVATNRMGFPSSHNRLINQKYIGIELCSFGPLQRKSNQFYDLSGRFLIPDEQVCILDRPFRTYKYWHKFSTEQLISLKRLILDYISPTCSIDFSDTSHEPEVVNYQWFEMDWHALKAGYGYANPRKLIAHTVLEFGKFDPFPQPELIELIKSIYK